MLDGVLGQSMDTDARMKNALVLAYIGDTVYDLYVRTNLVKNSDLHVNELNKKAVRVVNAKAQAQMADTLMEQLTAQEVEIFKRGRNARPATTPKNMSLAEYKKATGLEAVIGYLYLNQEYARMESIMQFILAETEEMEHE